LESAIGSLNNLSVDTLVALIAKENLSEAHGSHSSAQTMVARITEA
jgi:hypothetical protein